MIWPYCFWETYVSGLKLGISFKDFIIMCQTLCLLGNKQKKNNEEKTAVIGIATWELPVHIVRFIEDCDKIPCL